MNVALVKGRGWLAFLAVLAVASGCGGGADGQAGVDGKDGEPGKDGLSCWDVDGNGACDLATEDANKDGKCDALDCAGTIGKDGKDGIDGATCTVTDDGEGTKTITCGEQSATVTDGAEGKEGTAGKDGASCTATDNLDGTYTFTCGETSVIVKDGAAGKDGTDGKDGLACWDLDESGACDPATEDLTNDGKCNVHDCWAASGGTGRDVETCSVCHGAGREADVATLHGMNPCWDLNNNLKCDTTAEDKNADTICDISDCVAPAGAIIGTVHLAVEAPEVLYATIDSVTVTPPVAPATATVTTMELTVKDGSNRGVLGLKGGSSGHIRAGIAKLVPGTNGEPDEWVSYLTAKKTVGTLNTSGATTERGTLVDHGDGTYTYTFQADLALVKDALSAQLIGYDPALTHRVAFQISGSVNNIAFPAMNASFDFVPDGGTAAKREIARTSACNECHGKLVAHGSRYEMKYCVLCHNHGTLDAKTGASLDMAVMTHGIHSAHMRAENAMPDYEVYSSYSGSTYNFSEVTYPQNLANCRKCHNGDDPLTPQGDNWKNKPSMEACGSCHADVAWATHAGGQTDNKACATCHKPAGIEANHQDENDTPNSPGVAAGASGKTAANFVYEIKEVTVNASNQAVVKFRIKNNGTALDLAALPADLTGGPSFLLAYALPQGGVMPTDYNNLGKAAGQPGTVSLANVIKGTHGTLGVKDADGFYTATLTGTTEAPAAFPAGSSLRAVALQGYWTQKAYFADGTDLPRHTLAHVMPVSGDPVRRDIVDNKKCASCHEWFEGHGGNRVIGAASVGQNVCVLCHVPNLSTSGRGADPATSVERLKATGTHDALVAAGYDPADPLTFPEVSNNMKDMIHGIHSAATRSVPFREVRDRGASGVFYYDFSEVTYPNHADQCLACHIPGTFDADLPEGVLATTDATTTGADKAFSDVTGARKTLPNATDLVTSPGTATCASCHNSPTAVGHMQQNGGMVGQKRMLLQ